MGIVKVDALRAGMVLAADVCGMQGKRLFPAGVKLEDAQISVMKSWGVVEADIVGVSSGDISELQESDVPAEVLAQAKVLVQQSFNGVESKHPFFAEFYRLCVEWTAKRMHQGSFMPIPNAVLREKCVKLGAGIDGPPKSVAKTAEEMVQEEIGLISFPEVYLQIVKEMESPMCSARRLGDIVSKDTVLAAKILRLVNSPFYGFPSSIDSIERAITILGANELTTLALGISVVNCFTHVPSSVFNMKHFWEHSMGCGVFARLLASQKPGLSEERFFVGGLLHDIGMLVMLLHAPQEVCKTFIVAREKQVSLRRAEEAVFGFGHAAVGGALLREWGIPESLVELVLHHNDPENCRHSLDVGLMHVADMLALGFRNEDYGAFYLTEVPNRVMDVISLAPNMLEPTVRQFARQLNDVMQVFFSD